MSDVMALNVNHGSSNIVEAEKIDEIMYSVIGEIGELLKAHCGPYGDFAMIAPGPENPTDPPKFTKDGIHIIQATEFMNPIERQTKDLMAHIGSKVEKAAGDGTTSSMLIANLLISRLRSYLRNNPFVNYQQFKEAYELFVENITYALDEIAIKPDHKDTELVSGIAYNQSMTSSHGDLELSKMVADLMSSMPKHAWNNQIFERDTRESADRFSIVLDDSSYSMSAHIGANEMLNNSTSTEYAVEGADLVIAPSEFIKGSNIYDEITTLLNNRKAGDKPLVIITPYSNDIVSTMFMTEKFQELKREGAEFAWFKTIIKNPNVNDLNSLMSMIGKFRHKETSITTLDNVRVEYKYGNLYLYDIVEYDEDGELPDMKVVGSAVNTALYVMEEFLTKAKDDRHIAKEMVLNAKRMINCIRTPLVGYIKIGGTGYDNQASVDVLQDVLSATRESLTKGVVLGGYKSLRQACKNAYPDYVPFAEIEEYEENTKAVITDDICLMLASAFIACIDELLYLLYVKKCPHSEAEVSLTMDTFSFDVISGNARAFSESSFKEKVDGFIVSQPITTDTEFIKRFGEVAIKFLFTHHVLIPNTASIDDKLVK